MTAAEDQQARLYRHLVDTGALPQAWRPAYWQVPRHRFLPDRIWVNGDTVDRGNDPDGWAAAAYIDAAATTQFNDGDPDVDGSYHTSSASQPSVVFAMLDHLDVTDQARVLEIGTGTGWNAGLLTARLGADQVTTVEVDAALCERAAAALHALDLTPTVITGDGTLGVPGNAPYDRIIGTAAAQTVPYAWVEQTRPGGTILVPCGTAFCNGALLRLTVSDDGTAVGGFAAGDYAFMWLRSQRARFGTLEQHVRAEHDHTDRISLVHPGSYLTPAAVMQVGLAVPDVHELTVFWDDEPDDERTDPAGLGPITDDNRYTTYLLHPGTGSWAAIAVTHSGEDEGRYRVRQHGPRRLADEVETAWRAWDDAGRPELDRYCVRVDPHGQTVELDTAPARSHTAAVRRS